MRKKAFLNALTWLQINNLLYWDITINHDILLSIPAEFISGGISLKVVSIKNNSSERKGYGVDLVKNNDENNLHYAIEATGIYEFGILSRCIFTNVNISRQNPYLKLIFAVHNLSDDNATEDYNNAPKPVISYNL